jgi:DNA invertase Pin-like site-specific DNA recombinase
MTQEKITIGYCRSASHREGDYQQMDEEMRTIEEFAKERNLLINTIYIDWGVSGMTLDRPQWKRLMEDCRSGQIETVIDPTSIALPATHGY